MTDDERIPVSTPLDDWLDELAEPKGSPGGGSASGVMLAISAALLHMVTAYTPENERAQAAGDRLVALRHDALRAAEDDGVASAQLGAALAQPAGEEREDAVRREARRASESSAALGEVGLAIRVELQIVAEVGNKHLGSDTQVATGALAAGLGGAVTNLTGGLDLLRAHRGEDDGLDDVIAHLAERATAFASALDRLSLPSRPGA